jgi:hypothetical protein
MLLWESSTFYVISKISPIIYNVQKRSHFLKFFPIFVFSQKLTIFLNPQVYKTPRLFPSFLLATKEISFKLLRIRSVQSQTTVAEPKQAPKFQLDVPKKGFGHPGRNWRPQFWSEAHVSG